MERLIDKILRIFFKFFHIELKEETYIVLLQFAKFGIVGLTNTLVYYFVNLFAMLLAKPVFPNMDYVIGNIAGFIISVLWSFYWNNCFVFKKEKAEKRNMWVALAKAYASYAFTGIILSNVISYVLIDLFFVSKYIVPLINSLIGVPINFVLNKIWTFNS